MADNSAVNVPPPPPGFEPMQGGSVPPPPPGFESVSTENGQQQIADNPPPAAGPHVQMGTMASSIPEALNRGLDQATAGQNGVAGKVADASVGAIKGAEETAHTVGAMIPGAGVSRQEPGYLESKNTAQGVGKGIEGLVEFMAGDEALKGLSFGGRLKLAAEIAEKAEGNTFWSKIIKEGLSSLRYGTTSAGQTLLHGGSAEDALKSGAVTAGTAGLLGATGVVGSTIKEAVSKDAGTEASTLAKSLSGGAEVADQPTIVQGAQDALKNTEDVMHAKYDAGMKKIGAAAKDVQIPINGSPLERVSRELLGAGPVPDDVNAALKGVVPDKAKIEPLLQQFAGKPGPTPAKGVSTLNTYTWDQMEAIRQKVGQAVRDVPYDSPIKGDLIRLRSGIDETMQGAAQQAGKPELASQIKSLRGDYADTVNKLQNDGIKALRTKDPDSVAKILLNKQNSVERAETLRGLIGPENMKPVEGGIFQNLLDRSMDKEQNFNPKALAQNYAKISPEVKKAVWGDRVPDIDKFVKAAQNDVGARLGKLATAAGLGYGAWKIATAPDAEEGKVMSPSSMRGWEIIVGTALGSKFHIPSKLLANPAVLKPLTTVMEASGNPALRKAAAAATSQLMRAAHPEGEPAEPDQGSGNP